MLIHNGQSHTISRKRPRNFVRDVRLRPNVIAGHEVIMGQVEEGFGLQISPLISTDGKVIDAVVKCEVDQVEKFVPVDVELPVHSSQTSRVQVQVPQMVSWRLHERFRWPADQVLMLSTGVVATPAPEKGLPLNIPNLMKSGYSRADALLFISADGTAGQSLLNNPKSATLPTFQGKY